jgi:beta-phosphoglucomutase-like phosphatase (HAD superfamily)
MGFNKRKLQDQQREAAEREAAARRATDAQVLEDAERLIAAWNERQAKRMPMLFSPTIGAAITAGYWFLWVPARLAEQSMQSTCVGLTVTPTQR